MGIKITPTLETKYVPIIILSEPTLTFAIWDRISPVICIASLNLILVHYSKHSKSTSKAGIGKFLHGSNKPADKSPTTWSFAPTCSFQGSGICWFAGLWILHIPYKWVCELVVFDYKPEFLYDLSDKLFSSNLCLPHLRFVIFICSSRVCSGREWSLQFLPQRGFGVSFPTTTRYQRWTVCAKSWISRRQCLSVRVQKFQMESIRSKVGSLHRGISCFL